METAQLNLGFTQLTSPIDGIAGIAQQQVGNLVSPASGAVTTVSTLDPIKANFTVSEQEYLDFNRRFPTQASRDAETGRLPLELILADGTVYPQKGKFFFADRQVNQNTGAIQLTGLFPNPGNILRPGQYGRVRASTADAPAAHCWFRSAPSPNCRAPIRSPWSTPRTRSTSATVKVGDRVGIEVDHRRRPESRASAWWPKVSRRSGPACR